MVFFVDTIAWVFVAPIYSCVFEHKKLNITSNELIWNNNGYFVQCVKNGNVDNWPRLLICLKRSHQDEIME